MRLSALAQKIISFSLYLAGFNSFTALGFSLGVRPYVGAEFMTIPGSTLVDAEAPDAKLSNDKSVQRQFICYGGDLVVTPLEVGSFSISLISGFRMMKSENGSGSVYDSVKMNYVPVALSADYAIKKLRLSGYASYDLGVGAGLNLTVQEPKNSLDIKITKLSRIRFGALSEFFILQSIGLFGTFDYAMGSFASGSGPLTIRDSSADKNVNVSVKAAQNKLSGMTISVGLSYYFPAPLSQRPEVPVKNNTKPGKKKAPGKRPVKKAMPSTSGGGSSKTPEKTPPAE